MRRESLNADYIEKRSIPEPNSGCWLWLGMVSDYGYGRIEVSGRLVSAHRASFEIHKGPVPEGLHVCHKCDVRSCVNPAHLWCGTNLENIADRVTKGRSAGHVGIKHPSAKLTIEDVLRIRADKRQRRVIAAEFGIGIAHVYKVQSGEYWSHIPLKRERVA